MYCIIRHDMIGALLHHVLKQISRMAVRDLINRSKSLIVTIVTDLCDLTYS